MCSAVCWCEMIMHISGLCYLPILKVCGLCLMFIFIIKLYYNYNKLIFNFCLNTNSMWELYLFENIILTSFFAICLFNYICVPRSLDGN